MSLSDSLRKLPEHEPPPGGWADLVHRMEARRAPERRSVWKPVLLAAAASAVITSTITFELVKQQAPLPATASAPAAATHVAAASGAMTGATAPATTMPVSLSPASAASAKGSRIAALMQRSQELEQILAVSKSETTVWDARLQARSERLERGLSYVDVQLNFAQANGQSDQALRLWENRVQLMTELVATHQNARLTAGAGPENSI